MTIEIDHDRRTRALNAGAATHAPPAGHNGLLWAVGAFGAAAGVAGLVLAVLDAKTPGMHGAVYAAASFVLSGLAAAIVVINRMLADRQEHYRRGQLDGWMRGWRGQEPEVDDPLLR